MSHRDPLWQQYLYIVVHCAFSLSLSLSPSLSFLSKLLLDIYKTLDRLCHLYSAPAISIPSSETLVGFL